MVKYLLLWASVVAQSLKNLPAIQEIWVQALGREDPLAKEMATHSSILVWKIPWTEGPGGLQPLLEVVFATWQIVCKNTKQVATCNKKKMLGNFQTSLCVIL